MVKTMPVEDEYPLKKSHSYFFLNYFYVLLFEVIRTYSNYDTEAVQQDFDANTRTLLNLAFVKELKGPISALDYLDGYLLAAIGPKVIFIFSRN
jgi:hypothetical protein